MGISDIIENYLNEMFSDENEILIRRNDLAIKVNCVPSQINYVIKTRFTNENGFIVVSRRGGNGYVTIRKKALSKNELALGLINSIGESIKHKEALLYIKSLYENRLISEREVNIICAAISDNSLNYAQNLKDKVRAKLLKNIIIEVI